MSSELLGTVACAKRYVTSTCRSAGSWRELPASGGSPGVFPGGPSEPVEQVREGGGRTVPRPETQDQPLVEGRSLNCRLAGRLPQVKQGPKRRRGVTMVLPEATRPDRSKPPN